MSSVLLRRAAFSFAVAGLLSVSVTACGSSDADSSPGAAPTAAATKGAAKPTPAGDSKTVSAADLCGFLEKNLSGWKAAGSEFAAMTDVTTDLFDFYDEKGLTPPDLELDTLTKAECPDTRTEVLKTIGFNSFTEL